MDSLNKIKDNIFKSFLVKRNKFISPKFIEEQIEISNNVLSEDRLYIGEEIDLLVFNNIKDCLKQSGDTIKCLVLLCKLKL